MGKNLEITPEAREAADEIHHRVQDKMYSRTYCETRLQLAINAAVAEKDARIKLLEDEVAHNNAASVTFDLCQAQSEIVQLGYKVAEKDKEIERLKLRLKVAVQRNQRQ